MKPAEKASDVLNRMLESSPLGHNIEHVEIYSEWRAAAGTEIARHTRVAGIKGNVLRIEVDSSPWLYELSGFRKQQILTRLSKSLKKTRIVDIDFRIGSF
ncbi:MAG: DUF721 domain-containing protein [Planctomycetes bacterium]|nr:DUF721 domain-containing protein [Planctomycetota bacterium]